MKKKWLGWVGSHVEPRGDEPHYASAFEAIPDGMILSPSQRRKFQARIYELLDEAHKRGYETTPDLMRIIGDIAFKQMYTPVLQHPVYRGSEELPKKDPPPYAQSPILAKAPKLTPPSRKWARVKHRS